jgi:hypothetical protein
MMQKMTVNGWPVQANKTQIIDVKLMVRRDGGRTWVKATEENFPTGGLTVTLRGLSPVRSPGKRSTSW